MKYAIQSPKPEARRPKEGRNPKSDMGSDFWRWADELTAEPLPLREEPTDPPAPEALMERTARFGETIMRFDKKIPGNPGKNTLIPPVSPEQTPPNPPPLRL